MQHHDNERVTAAYMGVSTAELRKRRRLGLPPKFIRLGRKILYRKSDIEAFLAEHTVDPKKSAFTPSKARRQR